MSKYYKAEDMENLIINIAPDGEVFELGMSALQSLPTIEVSEEQLSKLKSRENSVENTTVSEDFTSISRAFHEQKEGEWIYIDEPIVGNPYGRYRCSECEMEKPHKTDYCPNCGAKMKGQRGNE